VVDGILCNVHADINNLMKIHNREACLPIPTALKPSKLAYIVAFPPADPMSMTMNPLSLSNSRFSIDACKMYDKEARECVSVHATNPIKLNQAY
jgi:hypothetical protein